MKLIILSLIIVFLIIVIAIGCIAARMLKKMDDRKKDEYFKYLRDIANHNNLFL